MSNKDRRMSDIRHAIDAQFSGVTKNPQLRQSVLQQVRGEIVVKKKISVGLVLAVILVLAAVTALAAVTLNAFAFREITTYDDINISSLLPDHIFLNGTVHAVTDGYVRGGYQMDDDCMAAMDTGDTIAYFDHDLQKKWELGDKRLKGCLYDRIKDTKDAIYFGTDAHILWEWFPSLMKISKDGEIAWQYNGPATLTIRDYIAFDSGDVYCVGSSSEKGADGQSNHVGVILKLSDAGAVEWERTYESEAITAFTAIHPFENGFIAAARSEDGGYAAVYRMDLDGRPIGFFKLPEDIAPDAYVNFRTARNGKLFVYMHIPKEKVKETDDWATSKILYTYIDKSLLEYKD